MSASPQADFLDRIDRHRGILFKVANAYGRTREDRDDLAQEIIVQLWRSYRRFDGRVAFSTWMYRIAMNVAISSYRRETRRPRADEASELVLEQIPAPPQQADADDRFELIHELIERLEPLERALMLLYLDDYSYAEIATILGISPTNVGTKIGRIKERLKRNVVNATN